MGPFLVPLAYRGPPGTGVELPAGSAPMPFAQRSKRDFEVLRRARVRQLFETVQSAELTSTGVLVFVNG